MIKNKHFLAVIMIFLAFFTVACSKQNEINHDSSSHSASKTQFVHKNVRKTQKTTLKLAKTKSRVIKSEFYSPILHKNWHYAVYLPAGYSFKEKQNFPVLYMMHGVYGKYDNLLQYGNSEKLLNRVMSHTKRRMVVVFIDGFDSFYVNQKMGMQMEDAIIKDLLPVMQKKYHLSTDREKNCIGGISMGGYGAARFSLKYPQKFKSAALISPAVWKNLPVSNPIRQNVSAFQDNGQHWSDKRYRELFPTQYINKKSQDVNFFVETTSSDTTVPVKYMDNFVNKLCANKNKVKYIRDQGDNHGWIYWNKALPHFYRWTLKQLNKFI